jgi:hypothetical protein
MQKISDRLSNEMESSANKEKSEKKSEKSPGGRCRLAPGGRAGAAGLPVRSSESVIIMIQPECSAVNRGPQAVLGRARVRAY